VIDRSGEAFFLSQFGLGRGVRSQMKNVLIMTFAQTHASLRVRVSTHQWA
jgi:hypothetical protein